ncbi:hypothetical protein OIU84_017166 [Salix udensis]|uniref:Uncharacterized protein n=1 Tax=Salix udensis TaxID=889485 RepID=A0AAD6L3J0_9ROSI|nr:hypothetical protein OIU84_017166 [Salix udensis]
MLLCSLRPAMKTLHLTGLRFFSKMKILWRFTNCWMVSANSSSLTCHISAGTKYCGFRDCPNDINEAVSTLIFASARCGDIPELRGVRKVFGQRYGQRFEKTALELLPGNLVNFQVRERLSILSVPDDVKRSLVDDIAIDYCLRPGILALEYASELQQRKEEEQRENQVQDKDVQNNFSKIEESKREVLDGKDLEGKAIFIDSRSTSHTSSDSINSSIAQQSSLDTLESPTCNKAEKEDNFCRNAFTIEI